MMDLLLEQALYIVKNCSGHEQLKPSIFTSQNQQTQQTIATT